MKSTATIFIVIFLLVFQGRTQDIVKYTIETKTSRIDWTGYGAVGGYSLSGTLDIEEGFFVKDQKGNLKSGKAVFDMKSIAHENKTLVKHLKGDDFFDVKEHPQAQLSIDCISSGLMQAKLKIKGVTETVKISYESALVNGQLKIQGKATIDRTLFGINYNSNSFFKNLGSNAIKDDFDVSFIIYLKTL